LPEDLAFDALQTYGSGEYEQQAVKTLYIIKIEKTYLIISEEKLHPFNVTLTMLQSPHTITISLLCA
jgi:hypothetical protein